MILSQVVCTAVVALTLKRSKLKKDYKWMAVSSLLFRKKAHTWNKNCPHAVPLTSHKDCVFLLHSYNTAALQVSKQWQSTADMIRDHAASKWPWLWCGGSPGWRFNIETKQLHSPSVCVWNAADSCSDVSHVMWSLLNVVWFSRGRKVCWLRLLLGSLVRGILESLNTCVWL